MGELPALITRREREAWARARAEFPDQPISREDEERWEATLAAVEAERDALREALVGLIPFARGNQAVLDRIHGALDARYERGRGDG